jgi:hypothetical protein
MDKRRIDFPLWINENTYASTTVVELGAGFFQNLRDVNKNVNIKVGIEIYQPYIDNAKYNDCIKIQGDVFDYKNLLKGFDFDTVMICDVLEHFEKDKGFELIENLKKDFNKILLMLPTGKYEQDKDVTGYGGHEYQTHKSYWYPVDINKLGFDENVLDPNFHSADREHKGLDTACYFGVWNKKNNNN